MVNNYEKYQEQYINTLTSGELVTLLYSEIIKNINKSIVRINNKETNEAHNNLINAQNILMHLIGTLDFNYEVSANLLSLYDYMHSSLVKANIEKNIDTLNQIKDMVTDLKNTWSDAEKASRANSYAMGQCI